MIRNELKNILTALAVTGVLIFGFLIGYINSSAAVSSIDEECRLSQETINNCHTIGDAYGISPYLLMAMIEAESDGNQYCRTGNCKGLMQVNEGIHKGRMNKLGVSNIYSNYGNILVGADYLYELSLQYPEVSYALDKYNGNSKAKYNAENGKLSNYSRIILAREQILSERGI